MRRNAILLLLMCILFGVFAAILARGEDVGPDNHPVMTEVGFSIGDYQFLFFSAMDQPLPHISGGFADYQGEQSPFHLPDFYIGKTVLRVGDLPDVMKAVGAGTGLFQDKLLFLDHEIALVLRELNKHYVPVQDGKPVRGYYAVTTAAQFMRAVFDGEPLGKEKWDKAAAAREPIDFYNVAEMFADRFSTDLNWKGEAQPGDLTPTCETGRWSHLQRVNDYMAWPDINDKEYCEYYLRETACNTHIFDDVFVYGQPTKLWRPDVLFRLTFIPLP